MKYWSIILVFATANFCLAQGPKFRFYITKSCSTTEQLDTSYELGEAGNLDTGYSPVAGTVHLPEKGRYMIWFQRGGPILDTAFDLEDTSLYVFRYKEPKVQLYESGATDTPPLYYMCDRPIDGYAEQFYPNGVLEMRGDFKGGYEKDSLVKFYPNGNIMRRINISPKIVTMKEYDTSGKLMKISHTQNKSFMTYSEFIDTTFYPNGRIHLIQSSVKRVYIIREFYPNGHLKVNQTAKNRIEYYLNGLKSITYKWTYIQDTILTCKDFTIYKNIYNKSGQIMRSVVCEEFNVYYPQPDIDISRSDWIDSITTYRAGEKTVIAKDVDTEKYLKGHPKDL